MKINNKKLIDLEVVTQSGQKLGKVEDFNIETESQSVLEYKIKPSNVVEGLIKGDFVIKRGQVLEINNEKMIVDDNLVKDKFGDKIKKTIKQKVAQGAMMKK